MPQKFGKEDAEVIVRDGKKIIRKKKFKIIPIIDE
jgi:hypothetical protein